MTKVKSGWVEPVGIGLSLSGLGLGRGKERVALQAQIQAQKPFTQVCDVELDFSEELLPISWKSYIKYTIGDRPKNAAGYTQAIKSLE